jgi:hypothetical protein
LPKNLNQNLIKNIRMKMRKFIIFLIISLIQCDSTIQSAQNVGSNHFLGSWRYDGSENMDNYMEALGVSYFFRKIVGYIEPTLVFEIDHNNRWTMKAESFFKDISTSFILDEEYEESIIIEILIIYFQVNFCYFTTF